MFERHCSKDSLVRGRVGWQKEHRQKDRAGVESQNFPLTSVYLSMSTSLGGPRMETALLGLRWCSNQHIGRSSLINGKLSEPKTRAFFSSLHCIS